MQNIPVISKSCLIVDDEPLAREVLEEYIHRIPSLHLVASCKSAMDAVPLLRSKHIDILFCDIKMPEVNGLDLIRSLDLKPAIIFTTAFSEYAVDGFEIGVTDYLVKPIRFERFLKAVGRAVGDEDSKGKEKTDTPYRDQFLLFKSGTEFLKIEVKTIRYVEAYGNYVKIYAQQYPAIVHEKISVMEELLLPYQFVRIHKSFIIPLIGIDRIENNDVTLSSGALIPIGSYYKKEFMRLMHQK